MSLLLFCFFSLESQLQSQLDFIMADMLFHLLSVITVIVKLKAKSRIVAVFMAPSFIYVVLESSRYRFFVIISGLHSIS